MNAATAAPARATTTRNALPAMLIGLLIFAGGVTLPEAWMTYLGVLVFLASHMLSGPAPRPEPGSRTEAAIRHRRLIRGARHAAWAGRADAMAEPAAFAPTAIDDAPAAPAASASAASRAYADATSRPALRVRPIVPLHNGVELHSWFGGRPYMPSEIDWPELDGKPALFIAQLSCPHIPAEIWEGRGPRFGWLLVFMSQVRHGKTRLIHINRFGPERIPPGPVRYPRTSVTRDDIIELATGRGGDIPRWPVEFTRPAPDEAGHHERAAKTKGDDNLAQRILAELDFTDPRFQPFDWGSVMVLVEVIDNDLAWQHKVVSALVETGSEDLRTRAFLDKLAATLTQVDALKSELLNAYDSGLPFDDQLRDLALRGLGMLKVDSATAGSSRDAPAMLSLLEHDQIRRDYFRWFDHYARLVYTEAPDALPAEPRALFEELWAWHALHERGWIGGAVPATFPSACEEDGSAPVPILRLQTSDLMGWSFGDQDEFGVFLDALALEQGDFSAAFGAISN